MLKNIKDGFEDYETTYPLHLFLKNKSDLTFKLLNKILKNCTHKEKDNFYIKPFIGKIYGRIFLRNYHCNLNHSNNFRCKSPKNYPGYKFEWFKSLRS